MVIVLPASPALKAKGEVLLPDSALKKKNNLSLINGPPTLKPYWLSLNFEDFSPVITFLPIVFSFLPKKYNEPSNLLVPDLVTALTPAPVKFPCVTSKGARAT